VIDEMNRSYITIVSRV